MIVCIKVERKMDSKLLEARNISFRFGSFWLKNVNFALKKGQILGIIGESGSGKTLLSLRILGLLERIEDSSGELFFENQRLDSMRDFLGTAITYIPQEPLVSLNPLHKINKQIAEIIKIHAKNISKSALNARVEELMRMVGLDIKYGEAYPYELSGGQRQRVIIAIALANNPKIIIADEPTTALDTTLQKQILDLLQDLSKRLDIAIILITHNIAIIRKYAQAYLLLKNGEVMEENSVIDSTIEAKSSYLKALLEASNLAYKNDILSDEILLKVQNLCVFHTEKKRFFGKNTMKKTLDNVNFTLKKGQILGVIGESGAGKSTLALALMKLLKYSGEIVFEAQNYSDIRHFRTFRKNIQIVFQDPNSSLNPRFLIKDIIKEGLNIHFKSDKNKDEKVLEMIECVGLDASYLLKLPSELSGGQRQRVAIARALILNPKILILDEPTSALDKITQKQVLDLLLKLKDEFHLSYILITHDLSIITALCDSVLILQNGKIVESCTKFSLQSSQNPYTKLLMESIL